VNGRGIENLEEKKKEDSIWGQVCMVPKKKEVLSP